MRRRACAANGSALSGRRCRVCFPRDAYAGPLKRLVRRLSWRVTQHLCDFPLSKEVTSAHAATRFGARESFLYSLDSGDPSRRSRANPVSAIVVIRLRGNEHHSIEFEFAEVLVVGEPPTSRL